ncbi:MAG TPA: Hsp20/alpha crystallin family protein [Longimicrobiaceae bacterium]|nr:Hsp20/alpha crystallin family protein [Longimicrobiaceae bacterium]
MAVTRFQPTTDMFRPFFEDFLTPTGAPRMGSLMRAPEADVLEKQNEILVVVEMPGMKKDEISIDLENNILTIGGEKKEERTEHDERSTWHLSERRYGKFSRSFVLPRDVEQDAISASFEDGVLRVSIPKSEKARRRRIEIGTNGGKQEVGS